MVSFHVSLASGPTIVLTASLFYVASVLFGRGGLARRLTSRPRFAG